MNIVKPYANILQIHGFTPLSLRDEGIRALKHVEFCGRISHRSEDAQTINSWERFIQAVVINHGDWSITEHVSVTCDFLVDRGVTHELVRHRLFAFTQESTRFVNYEKKMPPSFIAPAHELMGSSDPLTGNEVYAHSAECAEDNWLVAIRRAEESYRTMIKCGVSPQIARSVFPNALASRILITGNLRNWRHFLLMRTTKESHPQMREVTIPLLAQFQEAIPILYADIEPNARQIDNMRKPR